MMSIFNKLLRAGEKAEALRTAEGSAIDRLASNKLMTGRQAIGKYATDAGSWAIAGGILGSFAPVNPMGGGDSFGGATSGAMAGAMIGGIAGGRTLMKNMAKGRIVGSEAVDALASGVKNYKPRTINTFKDLAQDRTRSVTEGYKINSLARRGNGDYEAGMNIRKANMEKNKFFASNSKMNDAMGANGRSGAYTDGFNRSSRGTPVDTPTFYPTKKTNNINGLRPHTPVNTSYTINTNKNTVANASQAHARITGGTGKPRFKSVAEANNYIDFVGYRESPSIKGANDLANMFPSAKQNKGKGRKNKGKR